MIDTSGGGPQRPVFDIWLIACVWFADGVAVALLGVYLAGLVR